MSATIMDRLKEATAEQHRDAEGRRLQRDLVRGVLPVERYRAWLGQMLLLHTGLFDAIERCRPSHALLGEVVRDEGRHVANLRDDLGRLGAWDDPVVPLPSTARALDALSAAASERPLDLLGYNYVLEGSMNGNRFIARALTTSLQVPATAYLDPYGDDQRAVWRAYRARMNAAVITEEQSGGMITAAQAMFGFVAALSDELMADATVA